MQLLYKNEQQWFLEKNVKEERILKSAGIVERTVRNNLVQIKENVFTVIYIWINFFKNILFY